MGSLNINCPTNYIIMILINMFNDVLRKPLVTLLLGAENAQILSPCKESILKSCPAAPPPKIERGLVQLRDTGDLSKQE